MENGVCFSKKNEIGIPIAPAALLPARFSMSIIGTLWREKKWGLKQKKI